MNTRTRTTALTLALALWAIAAAAQAGGKDDIEQLKARVRHLEEETAQLHEEVAALRKELAQLKEASHVAHEAPDQNRMAANQNNAGAFFKRLVLQEAVWRQNDFDKNGFQDYWCRDVAGFFCVHDGLDKALGLIDLSFARADMAPARNYPELGGVTLPKQGYYFQAMMLDQDGSPYLQPNMPAPTAAGAAPGYSTNAGRFGFCAFPARYGVDGVLTFIVGEDGIIWTKDTHGAPEINRKEASPEKPNSGWSRFEK